MKRYLCMLLIALLLTLVCSCFAQTKGRYNNKSVYKCYRAQGQIKVDGIIDEDAWKKAELITDLWVGNVWDSDAKKVIPGHYESQKTRAWLLYDDDYIYVAAQMDDTDVLGMTTVNESEFVEGIDDMFEIFFKPYRSKPGYYELHVLPQNVIRDIFIAKRGAGSYLRFEADYKSGMETAVQIQGTINNWRDEDKGWSVEVRIPMSAFKDSGGGPVPGDKWQFLVSRYNYAYQLPLGSELVQMVGSDQINFHDYPNYPTIEFVK